VITLKLDRRSSAVLARHNEIRNIRGPAKHLRHVRQVQSHRSGSRLMKPANANCGLFGPCAAVGRVPASSTRTSRHFDSVRESGTPFLSNDARTKTRKTRCKNDMELGEPLMQKAPLKSAARQASGVSSTHREQAMDPAHAQVPHCIAPRRNCYRPLVFP
jgi:hypothetical protein